MNKQMWIVPMLGCVLLFANGCSKTGVVKNDEGLVSTSANSGKQPVKTAAADNVSSKAATTKPNQASTKDTVQKQSPVDAIAGQIVLEPISNAGELKVDLDNIYFDFDSPILSPDARKTLVKNTDKIKKDSNVMIKIEGNCDERGSEEYNLALGEKRARAAMQYLVTLGIPEKRLSIVSYGKERPVALGHDDASLAKNRRDEFVIVSK